MGTQRGKGAGWSPPKAVLEIPVPDKQSVLRTSVSFCILLVQNSKLSVI